MPQYLVVEPIKHAGNRHAPGVLVELNEKAAAPLLAVRAIEGARVQPAPVDPKTPPASETVASEPDDQTEEAGAPVATETVASPEDSTVVPITPAGKKKGK
jgi:hypothetical protein